MGILDAIARGLFRRSADGDEPAERRYGRLYNEGDDTRAVEDLHRALREAGEREGGDGARPDEGRRDSGGLRSRAEEFSRRLLHGRPFGGRTTRSVRRLERGVERIERAETPRERREATRHFRTRVLGKLERRADAYASEELGKIQRRYEQERARLARRGASDVEQRRAAERFEREQRSARRRIDRDLGRSLRGLSRGAGGSRRWRPGF